MPRRRRKTRLLRTEPKKHHNIDDNNQVLLLTEEDLISQLPDDILVTKMLSLLTFKEAGQTSVLSPRWSNLWTSHPNLNFDAPKIILHELVYNEDLGKEEENKFRENYLNWVNHVVRSYTGTTVHEFTVRHILDKDDKTHIDQWVLFALNKNVQRLTLDLFGYYEDADRYSFPDVDAFRHILNGVTSLTSLKLRHINVSGEVLQFLLSACPLLECLLVHYSATLYDLEVQSTSLKSLELKVCSKLTSLLVTAPNLVSITYMGHQIAMEISDSPKLTKMSFGGFHCDHFIYNNPLELSSYFSQLQVLVLDIPLQFNADVSNFPVLTRLVRLEVSILAQYKSLLGFASMLRACPALWEVSFWIYGSEFPPHVQSEVTVNNPHQSLKVVELNGFVGFAPEQLAIYLIKNAVMLEKIVFDTRDPELKGSPWEFEETKEREEARRRAKHLAKRFRPGVTSVII